MMMLLLLLLVLVGQAVSPVKPAYAAI